ncbi:MAG: tetratricopeptide repeat protein [Lewinellaceae bacterium]|nr:tetratricopeptide repeat protein [Lewinellaceae bacterium]
MKQFFALLLLYVTSGLHAQEKGLQPIPATSSSDRGSTYAVVVGISDYQDPDIPDLRFADKDAQEFARYLASPAGGSLDQDHLKVLVNHEATAAQFAMALDWLWEVVEENDRVIIYFSGHGDVERKSLTQPGYLLCWDAPSRVYLAGGAIALPMFQDAISTLSVQDKAQVIVITDACHAGKLSGSQVGGARLTNANLARQTAGEIKILSCQPEEFSIEGEQWGGGRGAFSFHLLDGLYGLADQDEDGTVNVRELGRYLEDRVSEEVAPHNQNPMIVGNKVEILTEVIPSELADVLNAKKGVLQQFAGVHSKGMEDDVLAKADSQVVVLFRAFQKAIADKRFLAADVESDAEGPCANALYQQLMQEPQIEPLHSSMRRNFAAALQDDAQQVMNTMLKSGLTEMILSSAPADKLYGKYPAYLGRAAELLGETHYMYPILMARKLYFEAFLEKGRASRRTLYREALRWQPDMPHAMVELVRDGEASQVDSVLSAFRQVVEWVPAWVEPYIALAHYYQFRLHDPDSEEEALLQAYQVDSTSVLVWYTLGNHYQRRKQQEAAEFWFKKTIAGSGEDVCFPCANNNLAIVYLETGRYDQAKACYSNVLELDSLNVRAHNGLGLVCMDTNRPREAEHWFQQAIRLDSTSGLGYSNLGLLYYTQGREHEAEELLVKAVGLDSFMASAYNTLGNICRYSGRLEEAVNWYLHATKVDRHTPMYSFNLALVYGDMHQNDQVETWSLKALEIDPRYAPPYNQLGIVYQEEEKHVKAEENFRSAIRLDSMFWEAYANLGGLYRDQRRWEACATATARAVELAPPIGQLIAMLGHAYAHLPGHLPEARKALDQALEWAPDHHLTYIYLAHWALQSGLDEEIWTYLEQGLETGKEGGELSRAAIETMPEFQDITRDARWSELMERHFGK